VLTSLAASQAITMDCKEFSERGRIFSIAHIEELGFDPFWHSKAELDSALEGYRSRKNYYFSALLVSDVVRTTSLLLIAGSRGFLKFIDYPEKEPGLYELAGVVSRKKQLLPYLIHCLEQSGNTAEI